MKYKRIEPGHYQSTDGRVDIRRLVSIGHRYTETVWVTLIDGKELPICDDKYQDAKESAKRYLEKEK